MTSFYKPQLLFFRNISNFYDTKSTHTKRNCKSPDTSLMLRMQPVEAILFHTILKEKLTNNTVENKQFICKSEKLTLHLHYFSYTCLNSCL